MDHAHGSKPPYESDHLARIIHEHLLQRPILSPGGLFSFGLLDGLQIRLRRPHLQEAPAGFGLSRFATMFMNNPG
jgi:hypothetical protein